MVHHWIRRAKSTVQRYDECLHRGIKTSRFVSIMIIEGNDNRQKSPKYRTLEHSKPRIFDHSNPLPQEN